MRISIRTTLGVALLAVGLGGWALSYSVSISDAAVLSAPLQGIVPPAAGHFQPTAALAVGDVVPRGAIIGQFDANLANKGALHEIDANRRRVAGALVAAGLRRDALVAEAVRARSEAESYRAQKIARLATMRSQAEARAASASAALGLARDSFDRAARLGEGTVTASRLAVLRAELAQAMAALDLAQSDVALIDADKAALERGHWLEANDGMPWPARFAQEAERAALLAAIDIGAIDEEYAALDFQYGRESAMIAEFASMQVRAENHSLIVALRSSGNIGVGYAVVDLADCSRSFVIAGFSPEKAARIGVNDRIVVRFIGTDDIAVATTWQILGPGSLDGGQIAAMPVTRDADTKFLRIDLPKDRIGPQTCLIGHPVEVTVRHAGGPLGGIRETIFGRSVALLHGIGGAVLDEVAERLEPSELLFTGAAATSDRAALSPTP